VGVDHIHAAEATRETLTVLMYVAMTRAKYRLVIPYVQETELVRRMKACLVSPVSGSVQIENSGNSI
jgi:ATP-dependent exoDNAse (exonuclease V) beta subunit